MSPIFSQVQVVTFPEQYAKIPHVEYEKCLLCEFFFANLQRTVRFTFYISIGQEVRPVSALVKMSLV